MNITGELFHLPHDAPGFLFEETHRSTIDGAWAVRHEPTHCVFEITLPDDCNETTPVNALMLGARLIHVCDGHHLPGLGLVLGEYDGRRTGDADLVMVVTAPDVARYESLMAGLLKQHACIQRFSTQVTLAVLKRGLAVQV